MQMVQGSVHSFLSIHHPMRRCPLVWRLIQQELLQSLQTTGICGSEKWTWQPGRLRPSLAADNRGLMMVHRILPSSLNSKESHSQQGTVWSSLLTGVGSAALMCKPVTSRPSLGMEQGTAMGAVQARHSELCTVWVQPSTTLRSLCLTTRIIGCGCCETAQTRRVHLDSIVHVRPTSRLEETTSARSALQTPTSTRAARHAWPAPATRSPAREAQTSQHARVRRASTSTLLQRRACPAQHTPQADAVPGSTGLRAARRQTAAA